MGKSVALITISPTLDIYYEGKQFSFSQKIFSKSCCIAGGGSGVNVARGLKELGRSYHLFTILGGKIGSLVKSCLAEEGLMYSFLEIKEETRVTTILRSLNRKMFVAPSKRIDAVTLNKFVETYLSEIIKHDMVFIGGSIPSGLYDHLISKLVQPVIRQGIKLITDTRGKFAQSIYKESPFAIKLDQSDFIGSIQGTPGIKQCLQIASDLHIKGISLVIHESKKFCYAIYNGYIHSYTHFSRLNKRTFGRGDAFLAGLIHSLLNDQTFNDAIKFGIACGASFTRDFPLGTLTLDQIKTHSGKIHHNIVRKVI